MKTSPWADREAMSRVGFADETGASSEGFGLADWLDGVVSAGGGLASVVGWVGGFLRVCNSLPQVELREKAVAARRRHQELTGNL